MRFPSPVGRVTASAWAPGFCGGAGLLSRLRLRPCSPTGYLSVNASGSRGRCPRPEALRKLAAMALLGGGD